MFNKTLKKDEVLFDLSCISEIKYKPLSYNHSLIDDENITLSGQSAFLSIVYQIQGSQKLVDFLTKSVSKFNAKAMTLSQVLISKTLGLVTISDGKLCVVKTIEFKGASSPSLKPESCTKRNKEANDKVKSILTNKKELEELIITNSCCAQSLKYKLKEENDAIISRHKLRFPSFIRTLFRNQKNRTYANKPEIIERYDSLIINHLNQKDSLFIEEVNCQIKSDIKKHITNTPTFNEKYFSPEYRSLLNSFIDFLPNNKPIFVKDDEKELLHYAMTWQTK